MNTQIKRLKKLAEKKGKRHGFIAKKAGISKVYLSYLFTGKCTNPSKAVIQRIEEAINI